MNLLHRCIGRNGRSPACRARAALVDAADRPGFAQHHRATRRAHRIGHVTDLDAGDGGEGIVGIIAAFISRCGM